MKSHRLSAVFFATLTALFLSGCAERALTPPATITWQARSFDTLTGWQQDDSAAVLPALQNVCAAAARRSPAAAFAKGPMADRMGTVGAWQPVCQQSQTLDPLDSAATRRFFEQNFTLYVPTGFHESDGLFTGYYEPEIAADHTRHDAYQTPIWARPTDMISVNLGAFDPALQGKKITGKVAKTQLIPYDDRTAVAAGSLDGRAKPLAFAKDPVDVFFLEVQGSGRLLFPEGTTQRVGYAAQNGHAYVPIGRVMAQQGLIDKPVTMQKIRAWLAQHPGQRQAMLNENPSVVFFKDRAEKEPVGALGIPLVAGRSLAVDKNYIPLGVPLWLATDAPASPRLVVSMDTGGAIKGPVRGDLFWGRGAAAEQAAGVMQNPGLYYLLLPKGVTP